MARHVEPQQRVRLVSILSIDRVDGIEIVLDLQEKTDIIRKKIVEGVMLADDELE